MYLKLINKFPASAELTSQNLKYLSLLTLTVQNSAVSLCMRYAKTRDGDIFFSSTGEFILILSLKMVDFSCLRFMFSAVFCAEMLKLLTCLVLVFMEEGTALRFKASLHSAIIKNKVDTVSKC